MLFHNLIITVMELADERRRRRTKTKKEQAREDLVLDALDVTYEDVLEYYRYSTANEQENDQKSS